MCSKIIVKVSEDITALDEFKKKKFETHLRTGHSTLKFHFSEYTKDNVKYLEAKYLLYTVIQIIKYNVHINNTY